MCTTNLQTRTVWTLSRTPGGWSCLSGSLFLGQRIVDESVGWAWKSWPRQISQIRESWDGLSLSIVTCHEGILKLKVTGACGTVHSLVWVPFAWMVGWLLTFLHVYTYFALFCENFIAYRWLPKCLATRESVIRPNFILPDYPFLKLSGRFYCCCIW